MPAAFEIGLSPRDHHQKADARQEISAVTKCRGSKSRSGVCLGETKADSRWNGVRDGYAKATKTIGSVLKVADIWPTFGFVDFGQPVTPQHASPGRTERNSITCDLLVVSVRLSVSIFG